MDLASGRAVAVIGLSLRLPGAADVERFWRNLREGVESIRPLSDEDLAAAGVQPDVAADPQYVRAGAWPDGIDLFDADFFGFTPREARTTDPQHRVFLECAWEALESAGYAPDRFEVPVGVFASAGGMLSSYVMQSHKHWSRHAMTTASLEHIGTDKDFLATQVAYKLDLRGPCVTVQTSSSSSLVAVHLAVLSLLAGDCDVALAGGVSIRVPYRAGYLHRPGGILSADGHCRAFDAQASGTMFGSGAGVVALKRLDLAIADGDPIRAVIRGSALANDGSRKAAFPAPSAEGQARAIASAIARSGFDPATIGVIEAHGSGTVAGDPIEVQALTCGLGETVAPATCALGSVKTNIGHLEAAAGIAAFIKTVLTVERAEIPPSLHFVSPSIDFDRTPFYVNTQLRPWITDGPRRAGVNAVGLGGTNAHVILEEAPRVTRAHGDDRPLHLLRLSARNAVALRTLAQRHVDALRGGNAPVGDVCFTANAGRSRFAHRVAVVGDSAETLAGALAAYAEERESNAIHGIAPERESAPRVAFVFTGQGSQYAGMGRELYATEPRFRAAIDRCAAAVADQMDLTGVLFGDGATSIDETRYAQPALFAVGYALAEVWSAWGVEPSMVMGHSVGELIAACVAGVFTPEEGMRLVAARGRLMQALEPGSMAAVFAPEGRVREAIAGHEAEVSVAAVNARENIVISGRTEVVQQIVERLGGEGIRSKPLVVSHAFHSPMMEPMLEAFEQAASEVSFRAPRRMVISNVTGAVAGEEILTAGYWREHVRATVQFERGVEALIEHGCEAAIEIGATATLLGLIAALPESHRMVTVASLRRSGSDWQQMLTAAAMLEVSGIDLDWRSFDAPYGRRRVPLPTYPFQRSRFW
ncbi:MAG TPA: type I polyketide synthase, partial [Thermoanaerobaculia bacterium]|nr:type I polyketide synthase [Thermoanaerobaculia bacterium]